MCWCRSGSRGVQPFSILCIFASGCTSFASQVGPEFEAPDGFWPAESRQPELQAEALEFQFEAHWLSGAVLEVQPLAIARPACEVTITVSDGVPLVVRVQRGWALGKSECLPQ